MDFKKIIEKCKIILAKLQNLPDKTKKIILIAIVVILALIMGYFWVMSAVNDLQKISKNVGQIKFPQAQTQTTEMPNTQTSQTGTPEAASWKTYANSQYSFEIKYPSDWNFRDYGTGAAFFPKDKPNEQGSINIGFYKRGSNYCKIPFDDYVKIAGPSEIQNYESLNTINGGSVNGISAYEITWNYNDFQGNGKISLPITYFETKNDLCGDIELYLNDNNYSDIYNKMIPTFEFTPVK